MRIVQPFRYYDYSGKRDEDYTRGYVGPEGTLIIPETVTDGGKTYIVTEIGGWYGGKPFVNCSGLTSITIPNSIKEIQEKAFEGCNGLTSVTIKSEADFSHVSLSFKKGNIRYEVKSKNEVWIRSPIYNRWDASASENKYSGDIVISAKVTAGNTFSVTGIDYEAFSACIDLTSVTIPSSVINVGANAFASCIHLTAIYCQAKSKPIGWNAKWNPNDYKVVWGAVSKFQ